jgi:twitching motility protein PilT
MGIKDLLELTIQRGASDLHIISGLPPYIRVQGNLMPVESEAILTPDIIEKYVKEVLNQQNLERFTINKELDFSLSFSAKARFRVNAYTQKGSYAISFRTIPIDIPTIDELNLPKILHSFTNLRQGFVLITGPTGHGKSTTLAAMLNEINDNRSCHIITIEDPVEFIFKAKNSIISQREMGGDTHSWQIALRSVLREDPDVVLIGEMRDYETISSALTVAETGHLVFATLHTNSASQTVDRIVDVFPDEQQKQVRLQLSNVIEAVFSMRLVPTVSGDRLVAYEVMLGTSAVKSSIREGKTHQIDNILQTSTDVGMNTLEMSLATLIKSGKITLETAQSFSLRPEELSRLIRSVK